MISPFLSFLRISKHRYKKEMAINFFSAVHKIANEYDGDARKIWNCGYYINHIPICKPREGIFPSKPSSKTDVLRPALPPGCRFAETVPSPNLKSS